MYVVRIEVNVTTHSIRFVFMNRKKNIPIIHERHTLVITKCNSQITVEKMSRLEVRI